MVLPHGPRGTFNESVPVNDQDFVRTCWIHRENKSLEGDRRGTRDKDERLCERLCAANF